MKSQRPFAAAVSRACAVVLLGGFVASCAPPRPRAFPVRPVAQRLEHGAIPGSTTIDRNVLEWRLDPTSPNRLPIVDEHDGPIVVYCQQGYSSSFAVANLVDLGLTDVHDLTGGFDAWAAAGLPVTSDPSATD